MPRAACGGTRVVSSWSESTYAQLVDMMSWIIAHKGCVMAHSKTLPARGEQTEQNSTSERGNLDCSVHSASRFGFSCSLGRATSNEATKRAMWSAEQNITARRAVLCLSEMKYEYFVPECCKQNAIFSKADFTVLLMLASNKQVAGHRFEIYLPSESTASAIHWCNAACLKAVLPSRNCWWAD